MSESINIYYIIGPLLVFGPLFLWILYNFGVLELLKIPEDIRRQREMDEEEAKRFREEHVRKRGAGLPSGSKDANKTPLGLFAQTVTYLWFAAIIGIFASWPPYAYNSDGAAQLKLSLSHPGQRKVKCRERQNPARANAGRCMWQSTSTAKPSCAKVPPRTACPMTARPFSTACNR